MGELLNGLLRAVVVALWFIVLGLGVYASASGWAADYTRDAWSYNQSHVKSKGKKAAYQRKLDAGWSKLAWYLAKKPQTNWRILKQAFPFLQMSSTRIGQGDFAPQSMTRERFIWHILPGPFVALFFMLLIEFGVYPMLRHKLAHWLALRDNDIFGDVKSLPRGDGFVLAHNLQFVRSGMGNPHVLTISPTGGGKTTSQVFPSIFQMPEDTSFVCTDPKSEIISRTAPYLESIGYDVIAIGPLVGYGHGWDPLKDCRNVDEVRALSDQILNSKTDVGSTDIWINMTVNLLSSYFIQAWVDGKGLPDGFELLYGDAAQGESLVDQDALFSYTLFKGAMKSDNTLGGILSTLQSVLSEWTMNQVVGFMRHDQRFTFDDLRTRKTALFLISSADDYKLIKPIQWLFFTRLFTALAKGGKYDVRIIFDEFANLGKLDNVDQALTLLRSAGVQIHAFVQNFSQPKAVYGSDIGDVVCESFGTICIMSGLRGDAKALAEMLGLQHDVRASYSTQDEKMRAQFGANKENVMEGSMLRQISTDEVLIISGNKKPVLAKMKPWYKVPKLLNRCLIKHMRKDWKYITDEQKIAFTKRFPVIKPSRISLPGLPKKKEVKKNDSIKTVQTTEGKKETKEDWDDLFR